MMENFETELTEQMDYDEPTYTEESFDNKISWEAEEKKVRYSQAVIDVTKHKFANYVLLNRCFCFAMIWIHLSMCIISILASQHAPQVLSESALCRYIFYSSHYFYGYIQLFITGIYLYLFANLSARTLDSLKQTSWIVLTFWILIIYTLLLKLLGDLNCTFWGIGVMQIVIQVSQFAIEGWMIKIFYNWLFSKTSYLRDNLEENIDIVSTFSKAKSIASNTK